MEQFVNNAQTALASDITSSATTLTVASAANFPGSGNFRLSIDSELLLCTAVSGTTFTVTRGIESTTAIAHTTGALVSCVLTAGSLAAITSTNTNHFTANQTFDGITFTPSPTSGYVMTSDGSGNCSWAAPSASINAWEHPFTKPTVAGLSFINTTGFANSDDTNGLFMQWTSSPSATDNLCLGHVAVPGSGAWNLDVRLQSLWADDHFSMGGAHLYESGTGKIIAWGNQGTNPGTRLCINYFNSTTSFNSQPASVAYTGRVNWLRIHYDGSANYSFWFGMDGYSWIQFYSASKTAFFTTAATNAGIFLDPNTGAIFNGVKCMSLTCA